MGAVPWIWAARERSEQERESPPRDANRYCPSAPPRRVAGLSPRSGGSPMTEVGFAAFDSDNHYYEATDAFIRHVEPRMHKRCMQWATIDGRERLLVAGRVNRFIPNPTFDPVARPGCLDDYFRGRIAARRHARGVREARADLGRLPRPRRPHRADGRAGSAGLLPVPDTGRRHGGRPGARRGRPDRRLRGLQPVAGRRLGVLLPRPALRGRVPDPGRPRLGSRRARLADRQRRASGQHEAVVGARRGRRPALAGPPGPRAGVAEAERAGHHGGHALRRLGVRLRAGALGHQQRVRVVPVRRAQEPDHLLAHLRRAGLPCWPRAC